MNLNRQWPALLAAAAAMLTGRLAAQNVYSNPYTITTFAGSAVTQGNFTNGVGAAAGFNLPNAVAVDSSGNVYVADTSNYAVRVITPNGTVSTLAGSGSPGQTNGTGGAAQFGKLEGIVVDSSGNVYVSDWVNAQGGSGGSIRKITSAGLVSTLVSGTLNGPQGLALDSGGNLYVADAGNAVIRKVSTSTGTTTVYAGTLGHSGFNDGAVGTGQFGYPVGLAFDPAGNLYVADAQGSNIRKVNTSGVISTYNSGVAAATPGEIDGPIADAAFSHPTGLAADAAGNLFVVDGGTVIREITAGGNVSTVAGAPARTGSLNAAGSNALFNISTTAGASIAATGTSTIFVADGNNGLIREGVPLASQAPTIQYQPVSQTINNGSQVTVMATVNGANLTYQWYFNGVAIPGANSDTLTIGSIGADQAGVYTVTASNSFGSVTSSSTAGVVTVSTKARIINLSTIDTAGSGANALAAGFSLSGAPNTTKTLLIRGAGPVLSAFGLSNLLAAPQLSLFDSTSTSIAFDAGWNNDPALSAAFTATGAFPFPANSADSALLRSLAVSASGNATYTAQVTGANGTSGTALVEIYDDDLSNADSQLVNISSSANVTPASPLTVGFTLSGSTPATLVIRAIGPALAGFGVPNPLTRTTLNIFQQGSAQPIYTDTGWSGSSDLVNAFAKVGAFSLTVGSGDSALLVNLAPGGYSAQLVTADSNSGTGLVEMFLLQ